MDGPDHFGLEQTVDRLRQGDVVRSARQTVLGRLALKLRSTRCADALGWISLARRSSRTARSSALYSDFLFAHNASAKPGGDFSFRPRAVPAISQRGEQPTFLAIDRFAIHRDFYSRSCSARIRVARSRASCEYLVLKFRAFESGARNPGRIRLPQRLGHVALRTGILQPKIETTACLQTREGVNP